MDWEEIVLDTAIIVAIIASTASIITTILGLFAKKKDADSFAVNSKEHDQLEKEHEGLSEGHRTLLEKSEALALLAKENGFGVKSTQEKIIETKAQVNRLWEVSLEEKNLRQKAYACLNDSQIATEQQLAAATQKIISESRAEHIRSNDLLHQIKECQYNLELSRKQCDEQKSKNQHLEYQMDRMSKEISSLQDKIQSQNQELDGYRHPRREPYSPSR